MQTDQSCSLKGLEDRTKSLKEAFDREVESCKNRDDTEKLRVKYIGRKGLIQELVKEIPKFPPEMRRDAGKLVNSLKEYMENKVNELLEKLSEPEVKAEIIDITLPARELPTSLLHPITVTLRKIVRIFRDMGFEVEKGSEMETDWYNFTALNIPPEHPARDMQDTFYLENGLLLRTHTSPVQIRVMEKRSPPIKIVAPGKVFRRDWDATHSPVFHQVEGLYVDKDVKLSHLFGTISAFLKSFFEEYGDKLKVRFRPSYFPFTEPSAEADISCFVCWGKTTCKVCKGTGYLEILGCGMVHPKVFENVGYKGVTGFAFGMGVERLCMLKYGVNDIRLFYEGDLRFLKQFK